MQDDRLRRMRLFYLYHGSIGVMGAVWGAGAILTILAQGVSLPLGLAGVGGIGLMIAVLHEVVTANPDEFSVGRITVGGVVLGAVLTLIGASLQLAASV